VVVVQASKPPGLSLTRLFGRAGYRVVSVPDPDRVRDRLRHQQVDAVVVYPADADAIRRLSSMRAGDGFAIVGVAEPDAVDPVEALDAGADDIVALPLNPDELLARLRAALRRSRPAAEVEPVLVSTGDFVFDLTNRQCWRAGEEVHLTAIEWRLIDVLVLHPGRLVTTRHLLEQVWGPAKTDKGAYLRVHMATIRKKLEPDPRRPRYFLTEPGLGLRFHPGDAGPAVRDGG
jgi:two-component system KDP operon response regulator KdpE